MVLRRRLGIQHRIRSLIPPRSGRRPPSQAGPRLARLAGYSPSRSMASWPPGLCGSSAGAFAVAPAAALLVVLLVALLVALLVPAPGIVSSWPWWISLGLLICDSFA